MLLRFSATTLLATSILVSGCKPDKAPAAEPSDRPAPVPPATPAALLDRLTPGKWPVAVVVDLRRVRERLGIGAGGPRQSSDGDPRQSSYSDPAQRHFLRLFAAAYPPLGSSFTSPVFTAVDATRVTAAATSGGASGLKRVAVLATDQPFSEIAAALEAAGYQRNGNLLRIDNPARTRFLSVVAGGPGVVAIGADAEAVLAAAEGRASGIHGVVRDLITELDAPATIALGTSPSSATDAGAEHCPTAIAVTDDIDGHRARLVVVTRSPEASRLASAPSDPFDRDLRTLHFDAPKIDGNRLTAGFTYAPDGTQPMELLDGEITLAAIYRCDHF